MTDDYTLGRWVGQLDAPPGPQAELATSGPGIDEHVQHFPASVIRWAATTARDVHARSVAGLPVFSDGSPQAAALRSETEAAVLGLLASIEDGGVTEPSLTWFQETTAQAFIQWRIPLTDVWASLMSSHGHLARILMRECIAATPIGDAPAALTALNEISHEFVNRLAARISTVYATENERMVGSELAVRQEMVEAIVRGESVDLQVASRSLRFDVGGRHHVSIVVWRDLPVSDDSSVLHQAAKELLTAIGSEQMLLVPQGRSLMWAWGNRRSEFDADLLSTVSLSTAGVRVGVGIPGSGADGFRQSHLDAGTVARIVGADPAYGGTVTAFDVVALRSVFIADNDAIARFVELELGPLAADDPYVADLRATLRVFLESRSPQTAAAKLYLARNTVNYRLRRAELLLGRPLTVRTLELWVALALVDPLQGPSARDG